MKKALCMPCTEAQFEAMRPKLETIEGLEIVDLDDWNEYPFVVNNIYDTSNHVSNLRRESCTNGRKAYPEFNEQIFLDACGYQSSEQKLDDEILIKLDELSERVSQLESEMQRRARLNEENSLRIVKMREDINRRLSKLESQPTPEIDYSKIKTGSKVKLKGYGDRIFGVVFWDSPYLISRNGLFRKGVDGARYFTFCFYDEYTHLKRRTHQKPDFITEVIQY